MTYKELYELCNEQKLLTHTKEEYFQPTLYGNKDNYWINLFLAPLDNEEILLAITLETFNSVEVFLYKKILSKTIWCLDIQTALITFDNLIWINSLEYNQDNSIYNKLKELAYT